MNAVEQYEFDRLGYLAIPGLLSAIIQERPIHQQLRDSHPLSRQPDPDAPGRARGSQVPLQLHFPGHQLHDGAHDLLCA